MALEDGSQPVVEGEYVVAASSGLQLNLLWRLVRWWLNAE